MSHESLLSEVRTWTDPGPRVELRRNRTLLLAAPLAGVVLIFAASIFLLLG